MSCKIMSRNFIIKKQVDENLEKWFLKLKQSSDEAKSQRLATNKIFKAETSVHLLDNVRMAESRQFMLSSLSTNWSSKLSSINIRTAFNCSVKHRTWDDVNNMLPFSRTFGLIASGVLGGTRGRWAVKKN